MVGGKGGVGLLEDGVEAGVDGVLSDCFGSGGVGCRCCWSRRTGAMVSRTVARGHLINSVV